MDLTDIIRKIPVIDDNVNYWMIRTSAGKYYDVFSSENKVAMGESYIEPETIRSFPYKREDFFKKICPLIEEHKESERPGVTAGQFYRFYHEIKRGDIVIIPSESSNKIRIGKISDEQPAKYCFMAPELTAKCEHIHSRSVVWISEKSRYDFNPNFVSLLFSHNAIVDANEYADYINGVIYDFFIKDNSGHLLLNVTTNKSIKARTLFYLFYQLLDITDDFTQERYAVDDIDIRINLNSPGKIELISKNIGKLSIIGLVVILLSGGNFKLGNLEVGTDGLIKPILNYINEQEERRARIELVRDAIHELNVKQPKEIVDLIREARSEK